MVEVGSWRLEVRSWKLEVGSWRLDVSGELKLTAIDLTKRKSKLKLLTIIYNDRTKDDY